jgi:hypothetical protein
MTARIGRRGRLGIGLGLAAAAWFLPGWVSDLRATRGAVAAYVELIGSANVGDVGRVRRSCSARYLGSRPIVRAEEGGVVGLPRGIHPNFRAWRAGPDVLLCPTNRLGPVYRFVREADGWKFDGPAGVIGRGGRLIEADDST